MEQLLDDLHEVLERHKEKVTSSGISIVLIDLDTLSVTETHVVLKIEPKSDGTME